MLPQIPPKRPTPRPPVGTGTIDHGGDVIRDYRPTGFWARITAAGAGNAYGYVRVDDGDPEEFPELRGEGSNYNQTQFTGPPYSGDGAGLAAYEVNGRTDVPADGTAVVWLEPLLAVPGYGFTYAAPGGAVESDCVFLGPGYDITSDVVWQDVGLSIVLPAAGRYLVTAQISGRARITGAPLSIAPLVRARVVDGAGVLPPESGSMAPAILLNCATANVYATGTATVVFRHVLTATDTPARTLKVQAARDNYGATFDDAHVYGAATVYAGTNLGYLKLG